ncbi:glycosyltransferase family protein [Methylobacterium komagatae]
MTGLSILLLDTEPRTHNHYIVLAIADALRRHPDVARVVVAHHGDALATFVAEGLDTFLAFGGAKMHAPLLGRLARLARLSILWTTEDPYERSSNVRFSDCFDIVFTNDRSSVAAYEGRAVHLPLAASRLFQDFDVGSDDRHFLYDLLFIGTAWPNRVASLNTILGLLPADLRVKIALPWNVHLGPPDLHDRSLATEWRCGNVDFARLANRSRVVLTLPRVFTGNADEQAAGSTPPPRLFETALAGGFQVMVSPEPEVRDYYTAGAEFLLCTGDAEAAEAIASMLAAPEKRLAQARAARARTLAEHLYDHRIVTLLERAASCRRRESPLGRRLPTTLPRRTVLILTHNRMGQREGGGVEVYQEALAGLADRYDLLFLFPVFRGEEWEMRLEGPGVALSLPGGSVGLPRLTDPLVEGQFARILFEYRVDLVHIHHLLHWPLSLPLIARACGVPVVYHLHDHYLICERWLLLDHNGRFCDVAHRGREQCDACLAASHNYPAGAKARRDAFMEHVVGAVDAFVTSTPTTGAYLRAAYPQITPDRVVEIAMLTPTPSHVVPVERNEADAPKPLVVAVIGNFTHHKGGDDIIELIRTCEAYPLHFRIYGQVSAHHAGRLSGLPAECVTVHGAYDQRGIVALLQGCDVSLHLSIWPETYLIALTEAWQAGLVPIVTDLGAPSERVSDGIDGFRVPPHDPGAVRAKLLTLLFDRERLADLRAAIRRKVFPSVDSHLDALHTLYADLMERRPCPHDRIPNRRPGSYDLCLDDLALQLNAPSWVSGDILWDRNRVPNGNSVPDTFAAVNRIDALPEEDAAKPTLERPLSHPSLAWALDGLWTDQRRRLDRSGHAVVFRSLSLRGWMHLSESQGPYRTYLRFSDGVSTSYAPLRMESRQDVVDHLRASAARDAGFAGQVDLDGLSFGSHAVDLIHVTATHRVVIRGLLRIFVASGLDVARAGHFRAVQKSGEVPATTPRRALPTRTRQSLPTCDGVLLGSTAELWAFEARMPDTPAEAVEVWLQGHDGTKLRLDAEAHAALDGTLRFVAALDGLQPTPYQIVLRTGRGGGPAITLPDRLQVREEAGLCRDTETLPATFRRRFIKVIRRAPNLNAVTLSTDKDVRRIRCQGWAFLRGLGPALCVVARWEENGRSRICIGAPLERPDIEAHLNTPAARTPGFDLVIPVQAITSGRVRFYQCYRWRTVEFEGFREALIMSLDMT